MKKDAKDSLREQFDFRGKKYFENVKDLGNYPWFLNVNLDRGAITLINRLRSGHTRCRKHLNDKNIMLSAECDCGAVSQDVDHLIFDCLDNRFKSEILMSEIWRTDPYLEPRVSALAFCGKANVYKKVFNYCENNGIHL